jgi:hypothetical protein
MKSITNFHQLEEFGLNSLTGEACKLGMRLLVDVNADGLALLRDFFGCPGLAIAEPWNTTVNEKPAVGSIMLTRLTLQDLTRFVLHLSGCTHVFCDGGATYGLTAEEYAKYGEQGLVFGQAWSVFRGATSRNVHAFTGRTA